MTSSKPRRMKIPAALLPFLAILLGILPHVSKLGDHLIASHQYWYDGLIHTYLSWERFDALMFNRGFFDFRWFTPYLNTGTYNEPALTHGLLFGLFNIGTMGEVWAFNLAMLAIIALNAFALYLLINDIVHRPWIAAVFATAGALSPFMWTRYFHPANTIVFWGLLGIFFLRSGVRKPTWVRCISLPLVFVIQLYSSLYAGMYFVVPLLLMLPFCLVEAAARKTLLRFVIRAGIATAALLPLLVWLHSSYMDTREQLGEENSYEYVSDYMRMTTRDFVPDAKISCQLKTLGLTPRGDKKECIEEMFPGRLVSFSAMLGVLVGAMVLIWRVVRRRASVFRLGLIAVPLIGLALALHLGFTLPFHLCLWLTLALPLWRPLKMLAIRNRGAIFVVAALLVADISVNPMVQILGFSLSSVHRYFFEFVPGFDGLRSEYRIVVLLPIFLAIAGATSTRLFVAYLSIKGFRRVTTAVMVLLVVWAVFDAQPAWQEYRPAPRSDRLSGVMADAAALPENAILAFLRASDESITKRLSHDGAYWNNYVMLHKHRQITNKSTYKTPASKAISLVASRLKNKSMRMKWSRRLSYMFGATHLIIDWSDQRAPSVQKIAGMLEGAPGATLLSSDEYMALVDVGVPPDTAHGPVPTKTLPGTPLEIDWEIRANYPTMDTEALMDDDFSTSWTGKTAQQIDDWLEFEADRPRCISGIAFTPGLKIERLPVAYNVELLTEKGWITALEQTRWEVPQSLIEHPNTGMISVPFEKTMAEVIRITITKGSPWSWSISEFKIYGGDCG